MTTQGYLSNSTFGISSASNISRKCIPPTFSKTSRENMRIHVHQTTTLQLQMISTGIGSESCALSVTNKFAMLFSFYGVVGLLLIINLMFFFCTVLCLRERQKETKFAHRQSTAHTNTSDPEFQRFPPNLYKMDFKINQIKPKLFIFLFYFSTGSNYLPGSFLLWESSGSSN